ncbi:acyl carrier protein [Candidatus Saccharibacteria bacterium]|nr:acyl carrier protein [Candidatus Saccharibacteria bacterium]
MSKKLTRAEVFQALDEVFQDVFDDDSIHVTDTTTAEDIEDWDSLEHINLVVAIENRFDMKFNMAEVTSMKNVGEMVDAIVERSNE